MKSRFCINIINNRNIIINNIATFYLYQVYKLLPILFTADDFWYRYIQIISEGLTTNSSYFLSDNKKIKKLLSLLSIK